MTDQIFVGREAEMGLLKGDLEKCLQDKSCNVRMIVGNAGDGKTTLVEQFAQFAEEQYPEKVFVAIGKCNPQTGQNDTYLPFREILNQLTGIQARLLRGSISNRPASWLRNFADGAILNLIELGPDLIGTFVPGTALLARLASTTISTTLKKRAESRAGNQDVKREEVREQYSAVLRSFAKNTAIIVIVDDLHWADEASLDLFVHLTKSLKKHPILIIGTYRPEDIEKDHPIVNIVRDLQAQFGEIVIDLRESREKKGEEFTNLFLAASRTDVSESFHSEFLNRTKGNALFTVELFRYLQEHKLLVKNEAGYWVESPDMDWNKLPSQLARLEGLIGARLAALRPELRQILDIASIEGQDFTAQVIKHFLDLSEFELLRILSAELEKQHNLVSEVREVPIGSTVLSHYRFVNATFHQYIYNDMSLGQRRLRHKEVADTLEELYGANSGQIAFELARHYELSYESKKVIQYLNLAGKELAKVSDLEKALAAFNQAESLARIVNDKIGLVDSIRHICGSILIPRGKYPEAEKQLLEALDLTRSISYSNGEIYILRQLGIIARRRQHYSTAARYYLESLDLARKAVNEAKSEDAKAIAKISMSDALNNLGTVAMEEKAFEDSEQYLNDSLKISIELNDQEGKLFAFLNLGDLFWRRGILAWKGKEEDTGRRHWALSKTYLNQALEIANSQGRKSQLASAELGLGNIASSEGNYVEATHHLIRSLNIVINSNLLSKIIGNIASFAVLQLKTDQFQNAFLFAYFAFNYTQITEFEKEIANNVISEIRANGPLFDVLVINEQIEREDLLSMAKKALKILRLQDSANPKM